MTTQQWVVVAELNRPAEDLEHDDLIDPILEDLADAAPAAAASNDGCLQITITLPANSLQQALANALPRLAEHGTLTMLSVLPETVRDAHEGIPPIPDLVSIAEAADMLGVTRQAVLLMVNNDHLQATKVGRSLVTTRAGVQALLVARTKQAANSK